MTNDIKKAYSPIGKFFPDIIENDRTYIPDKITIVGNDPDHLSMSEKAEKGYRLIPDTQKIMEITYIADNAGEIDKNDKLYMYVIVDYTEQAAHFPTWELLTKDTINKYLEDQTDQDKIDKINAWIEDQEDHIIMDLWRQYLDAANLYYDNDVYSMDDFDELMSGVKPWEVARSAFFGDFRPCDKYFSFNGYGNLVSFDGLDYPQCPILTYGIAEWCVNENEDFDYIDIANILKEE